MSCDTGIGGASGSLKPGVIAVVVNEEHYCLFNGDLVEGLRHDDNCYLPSIFELERRSAPMAHGGDVGTANYAVLSNALHFF